MEVHLELKEIYLPANPKNTKRNTTSIQPNVVLHRNRVILILATLDTTFCRANCQMKWPYPTSW